MAKALLRDRGDNLGIRGSVDIDRLLALVMPADRLIFSKEWMRQLAARGDALKGASGVFAAPGRYAAPLGTLR